MPGLILEGVTGSGKTEVLRRVLADSRVPALLKEGRVFGEDETFGESLSELRDPNLNDVQRCARLRRVMQILASESMKRGDRFGFLLERFHPSYYAVMPTWKLYANIDDALARLGCRLVLLSYPAELAEERALAPRPGDAEDRAAGLAAHFGSRSGAVHAVQESQRARLEMMARSRLPYTIIDTAGKDWDAYSRTAVDFWASDPSG
ncbi:MAG: hypothetical protein HY078_02265 [Elusimicrobia bacterium]|nr:hypothetical protein [Elusimicrobiota bacterium]